LLEFHCLVMVILQWLYIPRVFSIAVDKNVNKPLHLESMTPAMLWITW